jgi:hypothetical protein
MDNKGKKKKTGDRKPRPLGGNLDARAKRRASMGAMYQSDSSIGNRLTRDRKSRESKKK